MIRPNKTTTLTYSLLGAGASVLQHMKQPQTLSALWEKARGFEGITDYEKFILTLDLLHCLNVIELQDGFLRRVIVSHD